ncbi:hypothetical protein, phage-associated [Candidatus Phytoplasma mali]|uniref:Uncharacterized protein n=1 Tax=Phytoplasma mali (strain AT) TaxID=482235 RepID=B3QZR1_PHYMT|nr:hypothetical protein, phage-associated [Candidatus Phytoplasma mali]
MVFFLFLFLKITFKKQKKNIKMSKQIKKILKQFATLNESVVLLTQIYYNSNIKNSYKKGRNDGK